MGFVGLRVDAPHALGPLPVDDTQLLFTSGREKREKAGKDKKKKSEKRISENQINMTTFQTLRDI